MNSTDRTAAMLYAVALLTAFPSIIGQQDLMPSVRVLPSVAIDRADAALSVRLQGSNEPNVVPQPVYPDENAACDFIVTVPVGPPLCLWIRW